jgi:hypothetical protein
MFLEKIKAEGLAHLSYIVCDSGVATVIDFSERNYDKRYVLLI